MRRLRRYLPPSILLLLLLVASTLLLLTPVNERNVFGFQSPSSYCAEYGWPWKFVRYVDTRDVWGEPRHPSGVAWIPATVPWILVADLVFLATAIAAIMAFALWLRRNGGWRRYSLRGLLIFVTLVAVCCGWWMYYANGKKREVAAIDNTEVVGVSEFEYIGPEWLERFLTADASDTFTRATQIDVALEAVPEGKVNRLSSKVVEALHRAKYLTAIKFCEGRFDLDPVLYRFHRSRLRLSDTDIANLTTIEQVEFMGATADDETLRDTIKLPRLETLVISGCVISDRGQATLAECSTLKNLRISDCQKVTSAGLAALKHSPSLEQLSIECVPKRWTVATFDELLDAPKLRNVNFYSRDTKSPWLERDGLKGWKVVGDDGPLPDGSLAKLLRGKPPITLQLPK
jgi:hypothetical protein